MVDIISQSTSMLGCNAGWSSLVARRAHNPKVTGSNPVPATTQIQGIKSFWLNPFFLFGVGACKRFVSKFDQCSSVEITRLFPMSPG